MPHSATCPSEYVAVARRKVRLQPARESSVNQPFLPRVTHARRLFFEHRLMLAAGTGGQVVRFLDQQQAFARRAQQRGPLLDRRIVAANRVALALLH